MGVNSGHTLSNGTLSPASSEDSGGALWDIFRREDVPKLVYYLKAHHRDFRQSNNFAPQEEVYPIYDDTFYLTEEHKRKLKEKCGIEPWTFVQKLGEAVFIPAGCPHQVRNLKPCTKVALDFVSPENVGVCMRLAGERRRLPKLHNAKEDKLELKRMIIYAAEMAVEDILRRSSKKRKAKTPEFQTEENLEKQLNSGKIAEKNKEKEAERGAETGQATICYFRRRTGCHK